VAVTATSKLFRGVALTFYQSNHKNAAEAFGKLLDSLDVDHIFVSFDIDSISGADCPVSPFVYFGLIY
jgi:hypothetical protein